VKTNWQHQKDAITTDQKNRTDDEHIHEADKRHLKADNQNPDSTPLANKPGRPDGVPQGKKTGRAAKK
jgi:hypothetical protein